MSVRSATSALVRIAQRRRGLGHIDNGPDARDQHWVQGASAAPSYDSLEGYIEEKFDQGAASSCVASMTRNLVAIREAIAGRTFDPISVRALYLMARAKDGIKGDSGSRIRTTMAVLQKLGSPYERDVPYSVMRIDAQIPATKLISGWRHAGFEYAHLFGIGEAKLAAIDAALRSGHPVGFGAAVDKRFRDITGDATYMNPPDDAEWIGSHAMTLVAPRDKHNRYRMLNSYGPAWGDRGLAYVHADYIRLRARDLTIAYGWADDQP